MRCKNFFNLIEIAVAIAVLAVGLSSIMVLFPVGLNATQDAIADNNVGDVATQIMEQIRGYCLKETDWTTGFVANIPTTRPSEPQIGDYNAAPPKNGVLEPSTASAYKFRAVQTSRDKTGAPILDFDAGIRIWRDNVSDFSGLPDNDKIPPLQPATAPITQATLHYFMPIYVEISWPLSLPYQARVNQGTVRTYRLDLFNPNITL